MDEPAAGDEVDSPDEAAEVDRLRQENEKLRQELEAEEAKGGLRGAHHPRWRRVGVVVLLVLGMVFAPLSVAAVWVRNQVVDTSAYVANVAPLASDPAIQAAVADKITTQIFAIPEVQQALTDAVDSLPEKAQFLGGPLKGGLQTLVNQVVLQVVSSSQFQTIWVDANRIAHEQVVGLILGEGKAASVKDGKVTLDLSKIFDQVNQALKDRGIDVLDKVPASAIDKVGGGQFVLFDAKMVSTVQKAVALLKAVAFVLPLLTILFFAGAIWLAGDRRRAVVWVGLLLASGMGILALALNVGRFIYLDAVSPGSTRSDAAGVAYDTLLRFMSTAGKTIMVLGLIIAFAAFVVGPSRPATRIRWFVGRTLGFAGDQADQAGFDAGPVGIWVATHTKGLRIASVAGAALLLIWWERPTPRVVLFLVVLLLVVLAVIEVLAQSGRAHPVTTTGGTDEAVDDTTPPQAPTPAA